MANLEIIKSKTGSYKIISHSTAKHPALILIAELLAQSNKHNPIKVGVFSVFGGTFETHISVYSYISKKTERMNERQYNSWLAGERQLKAKAKVEPWRPIEILNKKTDMMVSDLMVKLSGLEVKL